MKISTQKIPSEPCEGFGMREPEQEHEMKPLVVGLMPIRKAIQMIHNPLQPNYRNQLNAPYLR